MGVYITSAIVLVSFIGLCSILISILFEHDHSGAYSRSLDNDIVDMAVTQEVMDDDDDDFFVDDDLLE